MSTALAAVAAAALLLIRLGLFVALHVVRSDYNPIEHAVSDYAVGPTRRLSTIAAWVWGAAWVALAFAVDSASARVWLLVLAVIFVALPFIPTDLEGTRQTVIGRVHYVAAVAWFAISFSLMSTFTDRYDVAVLTVLRWIALVSLAALVIALVVRPLRRRFFGLSERAFIVAVNLFYLIVAILTVTR
ncbi:DUF998 domain-containing protein [Kribbella antibiotica]|uniref:DUF998 domain-containing protein n=1 Tax=Kribbella antibiotica TaxID=190195 RepID=A0A4R4ZYF1_9ACTN|nr:DUF998 domain-containing protein [Kribbella antibiotica]TDD63394.1 DUF998 domain-containing protein [Kribbella antibiotica]